MSVLLIDPLFQRIDSTVKSLCSNYVEFKEMEGFSKEFSSNGLSREEFRLGKCLNFCTNHYLVIDKITDDIGICFDVKIFKIMADGYELNSSNRLSIPYYMLVGNHIMNLECYNNFASFISKLRDNLEEIKTREVFNKDKNYN